MKPIYLRIYDIALTVLTVIAALCLCIGCLWIAFSGGAQVYTPEKVARAFSSVAFVLWLWAALAVGRGILRIRFPGPKESFSCPPDMQLQRLQSRVDLNQCPQDLREHVLALRNKRRQDTRKGAAILAGCSALFLLYGANPDSYDSAQINTSVITALCFLLITMIIPLRWITDAAKWADHAMRIEVQLLKSAPASAKITPAEPKPRRGLGIVRAALLAAGLGLLLYGFFTGGTADVLTKAVNICTECVGLG